jgi:glycosyltransferase involved in cell wall biosynthesis
MTNEPAESQRLEPGRTWTSQPLLSLAVPFYNEEEVIERFFSRVLPVLEGITHNLEVVCVNDGSSDATWQLLCRKAESDPRVRVFDLSRNFGKEVALTAALDQCRGRAVVPIDADLQDPPELIIEMVARWREGFEVVVARRKSRNSDTMSKRLSAEGFYRLFNWLSDTQIPANAGDFRLMDRKVLDAMARMNEQNRFMKGLFAWLGFRTCTLEFEREARAAGETKWKKWKLWNFALDGIFAFTVLPLKIWVYLGVLVSFLSFLYGSFLIIRTSLMGVDVPGYASLMVVVLFLGGIQLIGLGVLGEYVGRIYKEVKRRPLYIIRESR